MLTQLLKISDNGQHIEPVLDALENPSIVQEINTIINNPNSNTTQRMVEMFGHGELNISFTINNNNNIEIRLSDVNFNEHLPPRNICLPARCRACLKNGSQNPSLFCPPANPIQRMLASSRSPLLLCRTC